MALNMTDDATHGSSSISHPTAKKPWALVADDDQSIRSLVKKLLQREGYEVDAVEDGVEAVEQIRRRRYTLVILDLTMPRLSGGGVIDTLVREFSSDLPRIVCMTAAGPSVVDRLPKGHIEAVITKPFDVQTIRDLVTLAPKSQEKR